LQFQVLFGINSECNVVFHFSAKTVTGLATANLTQASVLLHPSYITVDDVRGMYDFSMFRELLIYIGESFRYD